VDLREIVAQRVDAVAPLAWQRERVQVIADLPEALPPACADTVRVEQILVNLLRNALRHTPPGGIIIVSVATSTKSIPAEAPSSEAPSSEAPSGELCLRVCDTGEGIPEEDLAHVWERFYRGAGARSRDTQGAGLGLSLVKGLAEAMGGRVAVESEPGKDTCFYVWFPICS
jgi:signal transduction histidine kinase